MCNFQKTGPREFYPISLDGLVKFTRYRAKLLNCFGFSVDSKYRGVRTDQVKAEELFRRAAETGHEDAEY